MSTLGLGVVGLGWMGQLHSRTAQRLRAHFPELDNIKPIIACTRSETLRNTAQATLGFDETTSDFNAVVEHPGVDIVSICVTNDEQVAVATRAAAAGKSIWIEKPVGRSYAETAAVVAAARRTGVKSAVGFNYRQAPAVRWIHELISGGRLGEIVGVNGSFAAGYGANPDSALTWRFDRAQAGGGASADIFSHLIDLICYTTSCSITRVSGLVQTIHTERPTPRGRGGHFDSFVEDSREFSEVTNDDIANALLDARSEQQRRPFVCVAYASRIAIGPQNRLTIEIQGTLGTVSWNAERMNEVSFATLDKDGKTSYQTRIVGPRFPEADRFQPGPGLGMGFDDLKVLELAGLLRSRKGFNVSNLADLGQALTVAAVVDSLQESSRSGGEWVSVS